MKKLSIILCILMFVISCRRDEDSEQSQNSHNGKWFVKKIELTQISPSGTSNLTETLDECRSKSNFHISNQNVTYQEFSACASYDQYSGSYDNNSKKLILNNYYDQNTVHFDVEFMNNEMFVKNTQTINTGNEIITYKYTFICSK